ncbi:TIGR04086 family membrane protein [uncultured Ruminococcus sp.]|uniref:TIGR04086 family membrane protein n=1 Tax=uncultured Ruminococcus sp. TaxID=165186 RepID=UPI00292CF7CD|nr:TIGR04086 family membrane protein [uncultured Ruminococcus sp.]
MSDFGIDKGRVVKAVAIGVLCSVVLAVLLTCLFSMMLNMMSGIPYGIIDYVMVAIEGFSVLIGAYIACVIAKSKGLIIGALCGAISLLIVFAVGMSMTKNNIGLLTVIRSAVMLLCGVIGGIMGVNRKDKVRIK